jgi:hypothetical protein
VVGRNFGEKSGMKFNTWNPYVAKNAKDGIGRGKLGRINATVCV